MTIPVLSKLLAGLLSALGRWNQCFIVPEVVQASAMECGVAVLQSILEGFGIRVNYDRLRDLLRPGRDGTSTDRLETVLCQFGLIADQMVVPLSHLLLAEAEALPAILVVRLPNGFTHFLVVWRRHGPLVQVMDPAVGRRWLTSSQLFREVYVHSLPLPAESWRTWADTPDFRRPLARRLRNVGLAHSGEALIKVCAEIPDWRPLATLDAATQFVDSLVRAGALRRGRQAESILRLLLEQAQTETPGKAQTIPDTYWSVLGAPPGPNGEEQVRFFGAVLVRVRGRQPAGKNGHSPAAVSPELAAALTEPPNRPDRKLLRLLVGDGVVGPIVLAAGLMLAAGGVVLEAVLLRGAIHIGRDLGLLEQRLEAAAYLLVFVGTLLLLELWAAGALVRLGRRLEGRLRVEFLEKIPHLSEQYLRSWPTSEMVERCHAIHHIRVLPRLAGLSVRTAAGLGITAAAIAWIDPPSALLAGLAAVIAVGLPIATLPILSELDLRVRTHAGALSLFYLDVLLARIPVRAHGAERAVSREHESLLVHWARASQQLLCWVVVVEGMQALAGFGLSGWLLHSHASRASEFGGALLLAYWALNLPVLGGELAVFARQYPTLRNVILRLLTLLQAPEEHAARPEPAMVTLPVPCSQPTGVAITFESVTVAAGEETILSKVNCQIAPGSHVAIVGPSGSGKSTFVGTLLGWHRATTGRILIDGQELDRARLYRLRNELAWVDPAVQLWNRSLVHNLLYGAPPGGCLVVGKVLHLTDLYEVLERLPEGLQTKLGEGGRRLSGGEAQRVRLARALLRSDARLVILDEPFRGLDRDKRRELLHRARQVWRDATLFCITHDIRQTRDFDRVLVVEKGRVVENDCPMCLADNPRSRYRALLDAETMVQDEHWLKWKRSRLWAGRLLDDTLGNGM